MGNPIENGLDEAATAFRGEFSRHRQVRLLREVFEDGGVAIESAAENGYEGAWGFDVDRTLLMKDFLKELMESMFESHPDFAKIANKHCRTAQEMSKRVLYAAYGVQSILDKVYGHVDSDGDSPKRIGPSQKGDGVLYCAPFLLAAGVTREDMEELAKEVDFFEGTEELFGKLKENGFASLLVSSGYDASVHVVADRLNVPREYVLATKYPDQFEVSEDLKGSLFEIVEALAAINLTSKDDFRSEVTQEKLGAVLLQGFSQNTDDPLIKHVSQSASMGDWTKVGVVMLAKKLFGKFGYTGDGLTDEQVFRLKEFLGIETVAVVHPGIESPLLQHKPTSTVDLETQPLMEMLPTILMLVGK